MALNEPVADAGLGRYELRVAGVVAKLVTDVRHSDAQIMRVRFMGRPPDCSEQLLVRNEAAGMAGQQRQHVELLAGEFDFRFVEMNQMSREVDAQRPHNDIGPLALGRAAAAQ